MTTMTTATLAPFQHATEHPDYLASRAAREAAFEAYSQAKVDYWITCAIAAEHALDYNDGLLNDRDRNEIARLRTIRDAAEAAYHDAVREWREIRVRLGLASQTSYTGARP